MKTGKDFPLPKFLSKLEIISIPITDLKPYPRNAKQHPKKQIEGIAESIRRFGFTQPMVVDGDKSIIIGHGRVEAAKLAGLDRVPCIAREDLSPEEIKALRLIDNRIAETGWNLELLALEFEELKFDLTPFNIDFNDIAFELDGLDGGVFSFSR